MRRAKKERQQQRKGRAGENASRREREKERKQQTTWIQASLRGTAQEPSAATRRSAFIATSGRPRRPRIRSPETHTQNKSEEKKKRR
jgi:hypothetical protein